MASTTFSNAPARSRSGYMYFWLATVCAVFAFGAFAATYWLQLAAGTLVGASPLMHLHAALFSAWTLLLVSQTWLAARGRLDHHRAWGLAGIALASAMVVVGMALAIRSEADYLARGYGQAAVAFMICWATAPISSTLPGSAATRIVGSLSRASPEMKRPSAASPTCRGCHPPSART